MEKWNKVMLFLLIFISVMNTSLNSDFFLEAIKESSSAELNNINHHDLDKRRLITYRDCSVKQVFNNDYECFTPTGYNGNGNPDNCGCSSPVAVFNTSNPSKYCDCTSSNDYMIAKLNLGYSKFGYCYNKNDCHDINNIVLGIYCLECPDGSTRSGDTCDCSKKTDGNIYWRPNRCVRSPYSSKISCQNDTGYEDCLSCDISNTVKCVPTCPYSGYGIFDDQNLCVKCADTDSNKYIYDNKCVTECPSLLGTDTDNYCVECPSNKRHLYNNVCRADCPYNMGTDTNIYCVSCPSNKPFIYNYTCVTECPSLLGTDTDNYCVDCPSNKRHLYNNICRADCPSNMGSDTNINCVTCPTIRPYIHNYTCLANCPSLLGTNTDNYCVDCPSNKRYIYNNICRADCPYNMGTDLNINCVTCPTNKPFIYENTCLADCPYLLGTDTDNYCVDCPDTKQHRYQSVCRTDCPYNTGKNADINCITCPSNKPFIYNYTCLADCPNLLGTDTDNYCVECPDTKQHRYENACRTDCPYNMGNDTDINCVTCPSTKPYIHDYTCLADCPYLLGTDTDNYCVECPDTKQQLYENACRTDCPYNMGKDTDINCVTCPSTKPYIHDYTCLADCPYLLATDTENYCITCPIERHYIHNNKCLGDCPFLLGTDIDDYCVECPEAKDQLYENVCREDCPYNMGKDTNIYCVKCPSEKPYIYDYTCLENCPDGFGIATNGMTCIECPRDKPYIFKNYCEYKCPESLGVVSFDTCQECPESAPLVMNNQCVQNCDSKYGLMENSNMCIVCDRDFPLLYDQNCVVECPENYALMESDSYYECLKCPINMSFIYESRCIEQCPDGYGHTEDSIYCSKCEEPNIYLHESKCLSVCPEKTYMDDINKKCSSSCRESTKYIVDGKCSSSCPVGYGMLNSGKTNIFCEECTGDLLLFDDGFCKKSNQCDESIYYKDLENNKCVDCSKTNNPIYYKSKCIAKCPSGFIIVDNTCELESSIVSSSSNGEDNGSSTNSSNSPPKAITCSIGQEKVTDKDGNEVCFSCKVLKKFVENGECVDKCSENSNFDTSTNECLVCGSKFTKKTSSGFTCVDKCDSSLGYFVDSLSPSSCVKCSDNGKYIQDLKCVNKCKNYFTANSSNICISCIESDKKYILDTVCVASCPEGYSIKTVSGRENKCTFIEKDPTCASTYCKNNGKCSVEASGKLKCTCTGDYKGSLCDMTSADIQNISAKVNDSLNKLTSIDSSTPMSSSDLEEINSIKELIKEAPEVVSDEMINDLISVTSNQLKLIENLTVENIGIMDLVDTAFTAYTQSSKSNTSNIDISEVKDSVNKLTSSLTSSITNVEEFINNSGSSVLYSGDTFSIQLTDNSYDSLSESRKNKLTIVDYDQCTNILREAGVIGENENLYAQNILFDSSLSSNKNSSDISTSNSISTTIVNQFGKEVNTTLCNSFAYKMPINNNIIDVESQLNLSEQLGVDIFNSSDSFFSDICFSYPNNGTDVTVSSRRNKFNVTAGCSSGCTYKGVDEFGYVLCDCPSISRETSSNFEESVFDSLLNSNIVLFKCASNLLTMTVIYNAGFWAVSLISSFSLLVLISHLLTFSNIKYY